MLSIKSGEIKNGKKTIFKQIDLNLDETIYQLIGENGCGKTTFLKYLAGLKNKFKLSNDLFYLPEKFSLPKNMVVNDLFSNLGLNAKTLFKRYQLDQNLKIKALSKGMLQKVGIILSLLGSFDVILYDEPFEGLDDLSIKHFIEDIKSMEKTLVIITYHQSATSLKLPFKRIIIKEGVLCED